MNYASFMVSKNECRLLESNMLKMWFKASSTPKFLGWLILLPLTPLLFPFSHGGGPFPTTSFQILVLWSLLLAAGWMLFAKLAIDGGLRLPRLSIQLFAVAGIMASIIIGHGESSNPVLWVAPGLIVLISMTLPILLSLRSVSSEGSHDCKVFISSVDRGLMTFTALLALFHFAGAHESLAAFSSWLGVFKPVKYAGFFQQNLFSSFVVSVIGFSILNRSTVYQDKVDVGTFLVGFLIAVVFSVPSKIGWLALGIVTIYWLIFWAVNSRWRDVSNLLVSYLVGSALYLAYQLWSPDPNMVSTVMQSVSGNDAGISIRITALKAAWLLGLENPVFGHGLGAFQKIYPDAFQFGSDLMAGEIYSGILRHPHNEIAQWWVAGGVVGVLGVLLFASLLVISWFKRSNNLSSIVLLVPIALHSMVELPLYQSLAHWYLLALFLVWPYISTQAAVAATTAVGNPSITKLVGVVCFVCASLMGLYSLNAVSVAEGRLDNRLQLESGIASVNQYLSVRADDRELRHWAYRQHDGLFHDRDIFQLAMKEGNGELVAKLLPNMKKIMRSLNNQESWSLYAGALAGLGKKAELIGFIDYIEKLDPKYARGMRQAYGL